MTILPSQDIIADVRNLVEQDDLEAALDRLKAYLNDRPRKLQNELVLFAQRHNRLQREERMGTLSREAAQAEQVRISNSLLAFLDQLLRQISPETAPVPSLSLGIGAPALPEDVGLQQINGINNLKQISWIEAGLRCSKSVCRILTPHGLGSGFLIGPDLLMTNNHVIGTPEIAAQSYAEFNYQQDASGGYLSTSRYRFDAKRFHTSPVDLLDYTLVGVLPEAGHPDVGSWGYLQLNPNASPVAGEHVIIIQHPNGQPKQIALTANQVISLWEHRLHYTTDTMPGSSGSPVFNDVWQVIAIHHAGGELKLNAKGDKRFVNEGILMAAIRTDAGSFWPDS